MRGWSLSWQVLRKKRIGVPGWWGKKRKKKEKKKKKKKNRGPGKRERVEKKLRKVDILEVVKKKYILKNRIVKFK